MNAVLKVKKRMVESVSIVYPCDHLVNWELQLTAAAQHHKRISYCISLAQEKIKIQNSKASFY